MTAIRTPDDTALSAAPAVPAGLWRLCAAVGTLAVLISAIGSWIPSLWGDEAASVLSATRPLGGLFVMLGNVDAVHGAYYLGLHAWTDLAGSSPFAVRLPSALAIGVTAAAVTWICGRFWSLPFAGLAGLTAAVLPRLTYAGAEARGYAFSAALATALVLVIAEMMLRREVSRRWWIAYAAILVAGIWTFLYVGLMALVAGAAVLLTPRLRAQWRRWAVASAGAFVLASPFIVLAIAERRQVAFLAHRPIEAHDILVRMWFGAVPFAVLAWALIVVAAAGWAWEARHHAPTEPQPPRLEAIVLLWLILPMGLLLALSPVMAGYTARYGTFAAPAAAILIAAGIRRITLLAGTHSLGVVPHRARTAGGAHATGSGEPRRTGALVTVAIVAILATAAPVWISQRTPYAKNGADWNDIAATIEAHALPGDAIVFDDGVRPSRRPRLAMTTDPAPFAAVTDVTLKTPRADGDTWYDTAYTVADAAAQGRFHGIDRVWVVEYSVDGSSRSWGLSELEDLGFRRVHTISLHRSTVILYSM